VSTSRGPSAPGGRPPGERRLGRERALGLLYEAEAKGVAPSEVLASLPVPPEEYARQLVEGVSGRLGELDALIGSAAESWAVERMPVVDRQLLRLGAYELVARPDVPVAVVIDEAVELAKQYSTEDSGRFVNGVLGAIARRVRAGEARPA